MQPSCPTWGWSCNTNSPSRNPRRSSVLSSALRVAAACVYNSANVRPVALVEGLVKWLPPDVDVCFFRTALVCMHAHLSIRWPPLHRRPAGQQVRCRDQRSRALVTINELMFATTLAPTARQLSQRWQLPNCRAAGTVQCSPQPAKGMHHPLWAPEYQASH